MATLSTSAPKAYAALLGLIQAAAAAADPPVAVFPAELLQFEPGQYIMVTSVFNHVWNIEAMGYQYIESYSIQGMCTVFTGSTEEDQPGTASNVMADTYALYTNYVMQPVVENRGGIGVPVLGIATYPFPYEIKAGYATYMGGPGNIGGGPGGWQGVVQWSYNLKGYISPV